MITDNKLSIKLQQISGSSRQFNAKSLRQLQVNK